MCSLCHGSTTDGIRKPIKDSDQVLHFLRDKWNTLGLDVLTTTRKGNDDDDDDGVVLTCISCYSLYEEVVRLHSLIKAAQFQLEEVVLQMRNKIGEQIGKAQDNPAAAERSKKLPLTVSTVSFQSTTSTSHIDAESTPMMDYSDESPSHCLVSDSDDDGMLQ
jgi:hypothetical protein